MQISLHLGDSNSKGMCGIKGTAADATGGLNAFYWYQIFALDSVVIKKNRLAQMETFQLKYNVSSQFKNLKKLR